MSCCSVAYRMLQKSLTVRSLEPASLNLSQNLITSKFMCLQPNLQQLQKAFISSQENTNIKTGVTTNSKAKTCRNW